MGNREKINLRRMRILINRYPRACFNAERARSRAQRVTPQLTGMPSGRSGSTIADGALLLLEAEKARDIIVLELLRMRRELSPMLDELCNPLEKTVMRMRYMEGMSTREIAYQLCYSESRIFKALKAAERKIEKNCAF